MLHDVPDNTEVGQWWADEMQAWRLVADAAINHDDWQSRTTLLAEIQDCCHRYTLPPLVVAYRRYEADGLLSHPESLFGAVHGAVQAIQAGRRLECIGKAVRWRHPFETPISRFPDTSAPSDQAVRLTSASLSRLCRQQATTWEWLEEWLLADFESDGYFEAVFGERMADVTKSWRDVGQAAENTGRWRRRNPGR
jgi:hypothetical protein